LRFAQCSFDATSFLFEPIGFSLNARRQNLF
jgi:hypothetical protein